MKSKILAMVRSPFDLYSMCIIIFFKFRVKMFQEIIFLLFFLTISNLLNIVSALLVIRTSSPGISKDQWDCWMNQGLSDAIVRVYNPKGYIDAAGMANLIAYQD